MHTKNFALEVKSLEDEGKLVGYGSTFGGSPDSYGDVIEPGAYADSLVAHRRNGTKPKMLYQHDSRQPVGVWTDVVEDGKGLRVEGQLNLEKQLGREVYSDLKMGALDGLSIGFEVLKAEPDPKKQGVRRLKAINLWEISIVTFPANQNAFVTDVKATDMEDAAKWGRFCEWVKRAILEGEEWKPSEFEDILRDAGVPKTLKGQPASLIFNAMRRGDPGQSKADQQSKDADRAEVRAALDRLRKITLP